jgi:predicted ArsR family transcriptional regulator
MADKTKTTPTERACLQAIQAMATEGVEISVAAVGKRMGLGKSGAQRHMDSCRLKGHLDAPQVVGGWVLTKSGKREAKQVQSEKETQT